MGNRLIASSGESAAPIAPGKRDAANRGLETPASYNIPTRYHAMMQISLFVGLYYNKKIRYACFFLFGHCPN